MKIDVIRKLPEHMDTVIILHKPGADLEQVEYLPNLWPKQPWALSKQRAMILLSVRSRPFIIFAANTAAR
jgi:hypothetical protein